MTTSRTIIFQPVQCDIAHVQAVSARFSMKAWNNSSSRVVNLSPRGDDEFELFRRGTTTGKVS
jgi:hypothetical protein